MIGRLRGTLAAKRAPLVLVDVGGVGYELEVPLSTYCMLPGAGEPVMLHTHLAVREDAHLLYGFSTEGERQRFRSLIKISGVGAKLALTILSGLSGAELARCVQQQDVATLTRLPGIGKKTAERLIVEMRDRIAEWELDLPAVALAPVGAAIPDALQDALSALEALGYKPQEASRLVRGLATEGRSSEDIIRAALQAAVK